MASSKAKTVEYLNELKYEKRKIIYKVRNGIKSNIAEGFGCISNRTC